MTGLGSLIKLLGLGVAEYSETLKDVKHDNAIVDPNAGFMGKRGQTGRVQYQHL